MAQHVYVVHGWCRAPLAVAAHGDWVVNGGFARPDRPAIHGAPWIESMMGFQHPQNQET